MYQFRDFNSNVFFRTFTSLMIAIYNKLLFTSKTKQMKRIIFALCLLAAGCSSTSIVDSWKAPDATYTPEKYKKVLVVVLAKEEEARKDAENQLAADFKSLHVSYPVFSLKQLSEDTVKVKNIVREQGYDAVLTMRLITTKAKSTYVTGGVNPAYQQNYLLYYPEYYKSGSFATDLNYVVASNFYSLKDEKLLWSGISETANPKKLDKLINSIAKEVVYKMKEDKFITE